MTNRCSFIFSEDLLKYKFSSDHPFNQFRLTLTIDLLEDINALSPQQICPPRMAAEEELHLIHDPDYVNAVKLAGLGQIAGDVAENFGIGTEDNLIFPNMHEATSL